MSGYEGRPVLITFLDEPGSSVGDDNTLDRLIDTCAVETGIPDLAHQHDHYLHGQPKREG